MRNHSRSANCVKRLLLIDIDIPLEVFKERFMDDWLKLLDWVLGLFKLELKDMYVKKSRHGNTHITLWLEYPIPCDLALRVKFLLGDDRKRIYFQLTRFLKTGNPFDFFFKGD